MIRTCAPATPPETARRLSTEQVHCCVCGQSSPRRLYTERYCLGTETADLSVNVCRGCGQIYVSPRLDSKSTQFVYIDDQEETISHNYCWAGQTKDDRFSPLLDRLASQVSGGRLLDVGCGAGNFLRAAQHRCLWQVEGVDPSLAAVTAAREFGFPVQQATLEQTDFAPNSFDVITLLGVLEHLHNPVVTMRHVRQLLKPTGVVAIYVPNFNYLRLKDTGLTSWLRTRKWSTLAPQEHLFQFTPKLLQQLLRKTGFKLNRLDVGRPFLPRSRAKRILKRSAFVATWTLHQTTGIHLGGLEAIARSTPN